MKCRVHHWSLQIKFNGSHSGLVQLCTCSATCHVHISMYMYSFNLLLIVDKVSVLLGFFDLRKSRKLFSKQTKHWWKKKNQISKIQPWLIQTFFAEHRVLPCRKQFIQQEKYDVCSMLFFLYFFLFIHLSFVRWVSVSDEKGDERQGFWIDT